ncbi:hypothetical protein [Sulfurimonas sp.]|uniref:hypothetical protein n=1 Tax=Sulfurimonas sp. TaxID=2022749 RepID=UPI00356850FF
MKLKKINRKRKGFLVQKTEYTQVPEVYSKDKGEKEIAINSMTVTTESNKTFYADPQSRNDISEAIGIAQYKNMTETSWKLAKGQEPRIQIVTLDELEEVRYLALTKYGSIKGIKS